MPIKLVFNVLLVIALSACGWQLRGLQQHKAGAGTSTLPDNIYMEILERNSRLAQTMQLILRRKNVTLSSDAPSILVLESERLDKRPLAVTETGVTAQYQLTLIVRYHYKTKAGEELLSSRRITSWRSYDFDANLIVAKTQEEQALVEEMREELAYRILDSLPPLKSLNTTTP